MECKKEQAVFPVSSSRVPLFFDTLSAQKLEYVQGTKAHIYSYIKCYVLRGDLCLALYAFEKEPAAGSVFTLVIAGENSGYLRFDAKPSESALGFGEGEIHGSAVLAEKISPLSGFEASSFKGEDEQGFYWGTNVLIKKESLEKAGIKTNAGDSFRLGAFKYIKDNPKEKPDAYCLNFKEKPAAAFTKNSFPLFSIVDY